MLLSQTSRYALRAALHLAQAGPERPVPAEEIARALGVPRNYLSKTLHQLARAGVLESVRGPGGGFRLAAPTRTLSLQRIVAPVEPDLGARCCLLGRPTCSDARPCAVHARWRELADRIDAFLGGTSLADLAAEDAHSTVNRRRAHVRRPSPAARRRRADPARPKAAR